MDTYQLNREFLHPKYWLVWCGIALLFLTSLLPYATLLFLGKWLGRIASFFATSRVKIARRNIELCFPALSKEDVDEKVRRNFENSGIALFEMGMAWFWPSWRVRKILKVRGKEHIDKATENKQGIIYLGAHFLTIEMGGRAGGLTLPSNAVYRKHKNKLLDYWFYWGRMRNNKSMLDRQDLKGMLRLLKNGDSLWYAPDHDYGRHKSSIFAPLFAVENANTISGTGILARTKNSVVIPQFLKRLPGTQGYELIFYPPMQNFPSKDLLADTTATNQQLEKMIMECDDQYMWMHRRFKTRPEGESSFYE